MQGLECHAWRLRPGPGRSRCIGAVREGGGSGKGGGVPARARARAWMCVRGLCGWVQSVERGGVAWRGVAGPGPAASCMPSNMGKVGTSLVCTHVRTHARARTHARTHAAPMLMHHPDYSLALLRALTTPCPWPARALACPCCCFRCGLPLLLFQAQTALASASARSRCMLRVGG